MPGSGRALATICMFVFDKNDVAEVGTNSRVSCVCPELRFIRSLFEFGRVSLSSAAGIVSVRGLRFSRIQQDDEMGTYWGSMVDACQHTEGPKDSKRFERASMAAEAADCLVAPVMFYVGDERYRCP